MAEHFAALQHQNPRYLRKRPVKAYHNAHRHIREPEDWGRLAARREETSFPVEQMQLPVAAKKAIGTNDHRTVVELPIRSSLRQPAHNAHVVNVRQF